MMIRLQLLAILLLTTFATSAMQAADTRGEFNIRDFGATPDDDSDDTAAILAAIAACEKADGGSIYIPAGTYLISRQKSETPILELCSNATLRGDGARSILKFAAKANASNFWRMIGACNKDVRNITVRDLHLDGSNTHPKYERGVPEQNHGIFFSRKDGNLQNITIRDCLIENFAGDCVAVGMGCRNITITGVTVRNFLRQGIQLAGDAKARDYLVTGCQDLEGTVDAGGSTIHIEHARGLSGVILADNRCRRSILAGGVDGLIIRGNLIDGRMICNSDKNLIIQGNILRGAAGNGREAAFVQVGYGDVVLIKDNTILGDGGGIYVWGQSKYDPSPSKNVRIFDNHIKVTKDGIALNGVAGAIVRDNLVDVGKESQELTQRRCERVVVRQGESDAKPPATRPDARTEEER